VNDEFSPRGAIAAFVILVALYAAIWFALYFVAISRS